MNGSTILTILGYLYMFISQVMAAYFWWIYAKTHGFLSTIFIGPIVAEIKGIFWIFFIW